MPSGGGHIINAMAGSNPILCLRSGDPQNHIHYQRHRKPEPRDPEIHQDAWFFPTDEAATKLIYLAIRNFERDGRNVREWFAARNQFAIMFGERFDA